MNDNLRDELTALGRTMLARTNALADRVAVLERRAGLVPPEDADPPVRNDAALDAAVSRAWSALDSAVDGCPAGYAWLHDAVREARDAVGEIGELLRAAAPPSDPPTVPPDAALAVMVGLDRGAEEGEPTASRAGIDEPVVLPPGHSRTTGPWEPGGDDDYDDPSPWRPLPDPALRINERAWVTVADPSRPNLRHAVAAVWVGEGIWSSSCGFFGGGLAWMPMDDPPPTPKPWRGGR